MFKIDKLEPKLCNYCGQTTGNDGVSIAWSLHLEDLNNIQKISEMLHQHYGSKGIIFRTL